MAQRFVKCVPPGDERERNVCDTCGYVEYVNPKVVVGCLPIYVRETFRSPIPPSPRSSVARDTSFDELTRIPPSSRAQTDDEGVKRVLLCRRAIEPRLGKWGFPQGFMELGESARGGAARESQEEAGAFVVVGPLLSVYNLPGQVQLLYLATMECDWNLCDAPDGGPTLELGPESSEARFFAFDELPDESELAFPTVKWALDFARDVGIPAWDDRVGFAPQQRTKMFFGSWTDKVAFEEEDPILGWGAQQDEVTF